MYTTSVVAALAAFASYASAAPAAEAGLVSDVAGKLAFSLPQVEGKKVFKNGAIARQKAFQKYGAPVPADLAHAAAAAVTGSVTATPESYDSEYLCPVKTGADTLNLDFDTGSADLWVFSSKLPTSQQSGHDIYHCGGTLKSGYTWSISYGDGSGARGIVYADRVTVGGVTATSQAVEAATSISSQFAQDTDNDGLLGLAFSSINTVRPQSQSTFFDSVKSSLNSPLFAVTLKKGKPGSYDFGYIDSSKYSGSISYTSVDSSQGFWGFTATGYAVGSGAQRTGSISGIADTGTTLLLLPDSIVSAYYSQVSGAQNSASAGGYIFPCSATLPSFSVYISGQKRVVPGSYINFAPVSSTQCYGGIQSSSGIGINIFGDIFLKSQYVVFDSNGPRLGVAQQAGVTG